MALGGGCAAPPFAPVALAPLGETRPEDLRQAVASSLPERFTVLNSVVFEIRGRSLAMIGFTEIDVPARRFSTVAVTPLGMKLFEIVWREGALETSYVTPVLESRGDPVELIAADIRRIYFDRIPGGDFRPRRRKKRMVFTAPASGGILEYVLGGAPPVLTEKNFKDRDGVIWSVTYYEYAEREGKMYPGGIVLTHRRNRYRLTLRLLEIRPTSRPETEALNNGTGIL